MTISKGLVDVIAVFVSIPAAWITARKAVRSVSMAKFIQRFTEEASVKRHPVVLVGADPARTAELRTLLVQRGFRDVSIAEPDHRGRGAAVVVIARGIDLDAFAARSGLAEGLIFTPEKLTPPPGDWTFANSPITLFARLTELIFWQRSAGS